MSPRKKKRSVRRRSRARESPASPTVTEARFESFALQVAAQGAGTAEDLALEAVREVLGADWELRPLDGASGEFEARMRRAGRARPWKLRDLPVGARDAPALSVGAAWDRAYVLSARPEIVYAEPLFRVVDTTQLAPEPGTAADLRSIGGGDDDPATEHDYEWSLRFVKAREAWRRFEPLGLQPGTDVVVGHPDTGYTRHPEIFGDRLRIDQGWDFEEDKPDPVDPLAEGFLRNPSHGTGTSSVIMSDVGAQPGTDPPGFVTGIAPAAELIPIRTTKSVVLWSMSNLVRAIRHAIPRAHVVSISLGGAFPSRALHNAVRDAERAGVIVLAAAGNKVGFVVWPAAFDEVIAVAACTHRAEEWPDSCRGRAVDVTAPGASVWRAKAVRENGRYEWPAQRGSGTSFAVAIVAGLATLWLSYHGRGALRERYGAPRLAGVFKSLLERTCRVPAGWDTTNFGRGLVDADALLAAPLPERAPALGMRAVSERPVSLDAARLERLVHLFPKAPRLGVEAALAGLLRVDPNDLVQTLVSVGDELAFQLAVRPELRARVAAAAERAAPPSLRAALPDVANVRRSLTAEGMSRRLRAQVR